jgi:hypothetical protein
MRLVLAPKVVEVEVQVVEAGVDEGEVVDPEVVVAAPGKGRRTL